MSLPIVTPNPPATLFPYTPLFRSEMIALDTLPFGASRYPEWGSAAVVGGALFAAQPPAMPGALPASESAADYSVGAPLRVDRKSTRLNSSHSQISYAGFCLKNKNN